MDIRIICERLTQTIKGLEDLSTTDTSWLAGMALRQERADKLRRHLVAVRAELMNRYDGLLRIEYDRRSAKGERLGKFWDFRQRKENRLGS